TEKQFGVLSQPSEDRMCIRLRLMSHERSEASAAYAKDYTTALYFQLINTKEAKEGILHLQELLHVDPEQFHPFRIDPRTVAAGVWLMAVGFVLMFKKILSGK